MTTAPPADGTDARAIRRAAWLVGLAFGVVYVATAARYALGGDGGEFAALTLRGGVAHPPGYPLFVLWLRLVGAALPWLEGAHRASIATALLAAAAVGVLVRVSVALGASLRSALLVAALYGAAPLTWRLATEPEVFAGNALLALAVVWVASHRSPVGGTPRAFALALFMGLGAAHHHTLVLLAPLALLGVVRAVRESAKTRDAAAAALAGLTFGLAPYLYLWLAARGSLGSDALLWGDAASLRGLLHHVLRRDYGTFRLGAAAAGPLPLPNLAALGVTLLRDYLGLPVLLAAALVAAPERVLGERGPLRSERLALLGAFLLAGPLFVLRFNMSPVGVGLSIVERFHLLPAVLVCVLVAPAFDAPLRRLRPFAHAALAAVVALVGALAALPRLAEAHRPTVQRYAENVLALAPPASIVLGGGDQRAGSFMYARARGVRPDVAFVQPLLLLSPDIGRRVSGEIGVSLVAPHDGVLDAGALVVQLLATGRPVFVTNFPAPGMEAAPSFPIGPLVRLVKDAREVPPPREVLRFNEEAFARLVLDVEPPKAGTWAGAIYGDYARPWRALEGALRDTDPALAAACGARARELSPR